MENLQNTLIQNLFNTSNYEVDKPLIIGKKASIGVLKDENRIRIGFVGLRPKIYFYIADDGYVDKKTKKRVIKGELKFKDYKTCHLCTAGIFAYVALGD